jgi:tetratricopeptide (TPR) repeat protein
VNPADNDPAAVLARSTDLMTAGRHDENARLLSDAANRFPAHADIQLRAAGVLYERWPDEAAQCVRRAADAAAHDPDQLTRCGLLAFDLGDLRAAKEYALRVRALAPEGDFALAASLLHLVGKLAIEAGQPDIAEKSLRVAFERDPEIVGHGRVLATFLADAGRIDEALKIAAQALEFLPSDPGLHGLQAELLSPRNSEG